MRCYCNRDNCINSICESNYGCVLYEKSLCIDNDSCETYECINEQIQVDFYVSPR